MDRKESPPQLHYHIRWSGKAALDCEGFGSRASAEESAKQLVRRGETYTIEEQGENCLRCRHAFRLKTEHETQAFKYPWQQLVSDAFTETRREFVAWKVNAAQRAISARLSDTTPTDLDEHIAIREALNSLRRLSPDRAKREQQSDSKTESA